MSSHHFVREKQEPALLLGDQFCLEDVSPLLEWSPFIISLAPAIKSVVISGISTDAVIVKHKEASDLLEFEFFPFNVIETGEEDSVAVALDYLIIHGHEHVTIWTNNSGDYLKYGDNFGDKLELSIVDRSSKWSMIRSGEYRKWIPAGGKLLYFGSREAAISNGAFDAHGHIKAHSDGIVGIQSGQVFWIGESRN